MLKVQNDINITFTNKGNLEVVEDDFDLYLLTLGKTCQIRLFSQTDLVPRFHIESRRCFPKQPRRNEVENITRVETIY